MTPKPSSEVKKDCMFQYAYDNGVHCSMVSMSEIKIIEDTGLITRIEADALWDKYFPDVLKRLENEQRPQMCIWFNCENETDYGECKEIDWRDDLEVLNGEVYKKTLTKI